MYSDITYLRMYLIVNVYKPTYALVKLNSDSSYCYDSSLAIKIICIYHMSINNNDVYLCTYNVHTYVATYIDAYIYIHAGL